MLFQSRNPFLNILLDNGCCDAAGNSIVWIFNLIFQFVVASIYKLEQAMATHSSTLARRIPWTEKPGRLWSMGSLRVGHD